MKQNVIIELSNDDLLERLEEDERQHTRLKLNHAVSPIENPNKIIAYKKTVARLKTEIRKRQLEGKFK